MAATLVTGGCGFLGNRIVRRLARRGPVVVVDSLAVPGADRTVGDLPGVTLHVVDVRDREALDACLPPVLDAVVHLAAVHYIPYCDAHPEQTHDVNVRGTATLLDVLRSRAHAGVVLASSAAVYGWSDDPFSEQAPTWPVNPYGRSKVEAESLVRQHGVPAVAARLFNLYGPGDTTPHVVPAILGALERGDTLQLGNVWPRRDYVHVDDAAAAVASLTDLVAAREGLLAVNVATGVGTAVEQLLGIAARAAGRRLPVQQVPARRRADDGHLVGRHDRLTALTGWQPRRAVDDGLAQLVRDRLAAVTP